MAETRGKQRRGADHSISPLCAEKVIFTFSQRGKFPSNSPYQACLYPFSTAIDQNDPDWTASWLLWQIILDWDPEHNWGTVQLFTLSTLSLEAHMEAESACERLCDFVDKCPQQKKHVCVHVFRIIVKWWKVTDILKKYLYLFFYILSNHKSFAFFWYLMQCTNTKQWVIEMEAEGSAPLSQQFLLLPSCSSTWGYYSCTTINCNL